MNVGYLGYLEITPVSFQPGLRIPYFTGVAAMGRWHDSLEELLGKEWDGKVR